MIKGNRHKIIIVSCYYLPPNIEKKQAKDCMVFIGDMVLDMKTRFCDPYIVVAGDFNQWNMHKFLEDFTEIVEADVGHTRSIRSIDRIFSNISKSLTASGTAKPAVLRWLKYHRRRRNLSDIASKCAATVGRLPKVNPSCFSESCP